MTVSHESNTEVIRHGDGRVELREGVVREISRSPLDKEYLAPVTVRFELE